MLYSRIISNLVFYSKTKENFPILKSNWLMDLNVLKHTHDRQVSPCFSSTTVRVTRNYSQLRLLMNCT